MQKLLFIMAVLVTFFSINSVCLAEKKFNSVQASYTDNAGVEWNVVDLSCGWDNKAKLLTCKVIRFFPNHTTSGMETVYMGKDKKGYFAFINNDEKFYFDNRSSSPFTHLGKIITDELKSWEKDKPINPKDKVAAPDYQGYDWYIDGSRTYYEPQLKLIHTVIKKLSLDKIERYKALYWYDNDDNLHVNLNGKDKILKDKDDVFKKIFDYCVKLKSNSR